MPMYDYRCAVCNRVVYNIFRPSERYRDPYECPQCGANMTVSLEQPLESRDAGQSRPNVYDVIRKR